METAVVSPIMSSNEVTSPTWETSSLFRLEANQHGTPQFSPVSAKEKSESDRNSIEDMEDKNMKQA